jgi:hypothetical protein
VKVDAHAFSNQCRRVLIDGPAGPVDYEIARHLIEQGLADGRLGPTSKGRDTYGKTTQLVWLGITPAGRLWLEDSARAKLDDAGKHKEFKANHGAEQLQQKALESIAEAITGLPKPQSNLVKIAWALGAIVLGAMVLLLFKTHLGISL